MREVRIVDGAVVTLPDDPACWRPFARVGVCERRVRALRYSPSAHSPACEELFRAGIRSRESLRSARRREFDFEVARLAVRARKRGWRLAGRIRLARLRAWQAFVGLEEGPDGSL